MGVPPVRLEILTTISGVEFAACYARRPPHRLRYGAQSHEVGLYFPRKLKRLRRSPNYSPRRMCEDRTRDAAQTEPQFGFAAASLLFSRQENEKPNCQFGLRLR